MSCEVQALPHADEGSPSILQRAWRLLTVRGGTAEGDVVNALDPCTAPEELLRDIGLRDGRGPSLRRPERAVLWR